MTIKYLKNKNLNYIFKFIFFGLINTCLSNYLLIFLISFLPIGFATLASQICHALLGYLSNKYGVFKSKGNPRSYALLVISSWVTQWIILKTIINLGLSPKVAIIIVIPILALTSFTIQKTIIFR